MGIYPRSPRNLHDAAMKNPHSILYRMGICFCLPMQKVNVTSDR